MVTIKGADQTRRDEGSPFIVDFVTQKPPRSEEYSLPSRATPPIHPLTPAFRESSTGAKSICGIETRPREKRTAPRCLHSGYIALYGVSQNHRISCRLIRTNLGSTSSFDEKFGARSIIVLGFSQL